jgi:integrase
MSKSKRKRRTFGAIRKLASGKYQASYQDNYGNRFTAPDTFTSYERADLFLAEKQVEISKGLFIDPRKGKITLKDWWLEYSESKQDWAETTRQGNEHRAKTYLLASYPDICLATMPLQEITPYAVQKWWSNVQKATERKTHEVFNSPKSDTRNARNWAYKNNIPVPITGRLSPAIIEKWKSAGSPSFSQLINSPRFERAGASAASDCYKLLRQLFIAAVKCELIYKNPVNIKGADKVERADRKPATDQQIVDLALAVPERYRAAVRVSAYSGLRQGELFALQRKDYNRETKEITVNKSKYEVGSVAKIGSPKTKTSYRSVTLPDKIAKELELHLDTFVTDPSPTALIFATQLGTMVTRANLYSWFNPAKQRLNLGDLHWHDLRHTSQNAAAKAGANTKEIMQRAGHKDFRASMIYTYADPEADKNLAVRIDENIIELDLYRSA